MAKKKTTTHSINSYDDAVTELQALVAAVEDETVGIDDLENKVKRASVLVQFCREKLRSTEDTINQSFEDLS